MPTRRPPIEDEGPEPLPVTDKQLELLRTMRRWSVENGRMPSIRELADVLERSPSTIHQHIGALERRGCIERDGNAHGLRLTVDDKQLGVGMRGNQLPLKGKLVPGRRMRRNKTPYPRVTVGGEPRKGDYVLQVEGDRLASDGIARISGNASRTRLRTSASRHDWAGVLRIASTKRLARPPAPPPCPGPSRFSRFAICGAKNSVRMCRRVCDSPM